jgi:hypothetical protein
LKTVRFLMTALITITGLATSPLAQASIDVKPMLTKCTYNIYQPYISHNVMIGNTQQTSCTVKPKTADVWSELQIYREGQWMTVSPRVHNYTATMGQVTAQAKVICQGTSPFYTWRIHGGVKYTFTDGNPVTGEQYGRAANLYCVAKK